MSLNIEAIEGVRLALGLGVQDFCAKLDVDIDFYETLRNLGDVSNFPPHAVNLVRGMMLELERKNLERYRERLQHRGNGHFSGKKVLHHLDRVHLLQKSDPACSPITVEIHPADVCNHRCPMCVNATPFRVGRSGMLDFALVPKLVADFKQLGVKAVNLSGGGEPLLHPKLGTMIRMLRDANIEVGVITNGTLFDNPNYEQVRDDIVRLCTYCRVSVDAGSQAVYERMHGKATDVDFDKLCRAVSGLVGHKRKGGGAATLGVSFLLTPNNYLDLVKSACVFRDLGVDYFQVKPIVMPSVGRVDSGMVFWDARLFDMLVALDAYQTPTFKVYTLGYKFADMLLNEHVGLPFSRCWGHPLYPTITADGSVLVCCDMVNPHKEKRAVSLIICNSLSSDCILTKF